MPEFLPVAERYITALIFTPGLQPPTTELVERRTSSESVLAGVAGLVDRVGEAETKLRFWRALFDYVPDSLYLVRDGVIVRQNQACKRLFGGLVVGQTMEEKCADCSGAKHGEKGCEVLQAIRTGTSMQTRKVVEGIDCFVSVTAVPMGSYTMFLVCHTNVTPYAIARSSV